MNALDILNKYSENMFEGKVFTDNEGNPYTNCRLIYNQDYGTNEFEPSVYMQITDNKGNIRVFDSKNQIMQLINGNKNIFEILQTFQGKIFNGRTFTDKKGNVYNNLTFVMPDSSEHLFMVQNQRNKKDAQILYLQNLQNLEEIIN